jgi:Ca2+-binding EF-hand superfamily protein
VIGEDELRVFMHSFFEQLTEDVNESMRVLETLLSPDNDDVITVATRARDSCQQFVDSYTDAVVQNVFRAAKSGSAKKRGRTAARDDDDDEPQKLFVSEFTRWCRENNDCVLAFFESLSHEILTEMGAVKVSNNPNVDVPSGRKPHDHRSKLSRLIDPQHHLRKPHLPHMHHDHHHGDELVASHHDTSQRYHTAPVLSEDFHRVLAATGIEVDAGVIQRHAEHWAKIAGTATNRPISDQVAHVEANRNLIEGKRAMKRGDLEEAVFLFKRGIEQQKQLDQEQLSARRVTREEADAHNDRTDDLHRKGILNREQAESLKGGISESLEDELEKAINACDERDFIIVDSMMAQQKAGTSALDKKHAEVKQPGRLTGAPQVPPPSSCFPRDEVHRIQDIFLAVSQDGAMGPAEWTRCLRFAGIENEVTALRLFELFDTSGDLQLNAKEFTCGLSEICNAYQPGKAVEDVRREFTFRFYDVDGEGHFDKKECCAHLKSYRLAARKSVDRQITQFCTAVGMDERALTEKVGPKLAKLTDQLDEDLTDFVEDIFALFGDDKAERMNWDHFKRFTLKAPMVVEWLTNLGKELKESFTKMDKGLNFEDAAPVPEPGSVISDELIFSAFTRFAGEGGDNALIDEGEFVELMTKELKVDNKRLARLLFRAFDEGGNGTVTRSEFVSHWKMLTSDDIEPKRPIVFKLFDVNGQGFVDKGSLKLFFLSFFDAALESVGTLRKGLDEWVNGKPHPGSKLSNGIPNHFFVGVSRKKKFQLAKDLVKLAQAQASFFVDVAVDHALRKVKSTLTLREGFTEFLNDYMAFVNWLSSIAAPWMVLPVVADADVNPELVVIQPGDIGKTAADVLDAASKDAMMTAGVAQLAPGSVWWARAMAPWPGKSTRIVMRPQTHFDRVWLADIKSLFADEIAACRVYDPESLAVVLDHGIGLTNPLIVDRLYRMFDVNQDGNLTAAEIATGLLLLGMGSLSERMQLAFDLFDVGRDGIMMSQELGTFLSALRAVSIDVISSQIELLGEVFGPPASGVGHGVRRATEFKENINAEARQSLDARVETLQERAFAIDDVDAAGAASMTRAEFMLFLEVQPALESWVSRLGVGCLEALAPLEDRALPTTGRRPTDSTYRSRRKYPKGTQFDHLRAGDILEMVKRHAHYGWLDQHAFAQAMSELRIYDPATLQRVHTLLDFSNGGSVTTAPTGGADEYNRASLNTRVHVRDASASLLLLSGDSWRVKLRHAFFLFDADGRGRLYRAEWQQLLRAFGVVGLDVIHTAVGGGLIADLVGDVGTVAFTATVLGLSHGRLQGWLSVLDKSCRLFCDLAREKRRQNLLGRGAAGVAALAAMEDEDKPDTYVWEDVEQWALGQADFGRWMDSLRNLWLESILESESGPGGATVDDMGPAKGNQLAARGEYGYDFIVKKVFALQMPPPSPQDGPATAKERGATSVLAKRLQYTNPYTMPLSISLHTDSPAVLTATFCGDPEAERSRQAILLAGGGAQIAPGCSTKLSLRFVAPPSDRRRRGREAGGSGEAGGKEVTIRLFVHNETEQRCEECIQFDLSGL